MMMPKPTIAVQPTLPPFSLVTSHPMQRDPRSSPYGLYLVHSLGAGGGQGFYWFRHEADAVACIRTLAEQSPESEELAPLLLDVNNFEDLSLELINRTQLQFTVRWAGRFEQLWDSDSRFAREIRNDFTPLYESRHPDDDFMANLDKFVRHLEVYAAHHPERNYVSEFSLNRPVD